MKNILLISTLFFLFTLTSNSQIAINEIQAATQGNGSKKEFIELKGPANASLDGYLLILVDGDSDATYGCYDLDGQAFSPTGYFVIGNVNGAYQPSSIPDKNWLQNGVDGVALYQLPSCPPNGTLCSALPAADLKSHLVYYSISANINLLTCYPGAQHLESDASGVSLNSDGTGTWYLAVQTIGVENNPLGSLPVELTSFESKVIDNNSVILFWSTASEENNSHFVIEHSRDGHRFSEIGQEAGMGSTTIAHTYHMRHQRLPKGFHYYRLKQVDFDGKHEYSNIISAKLNLTLADVSVAPNPAMETVTIFIDTPISIAASYQLVNMQKEVMIEKTIAEGNSSFEIDMTNLPGGVYFMRFYVDQQVIAKKIVKLY